MPNILSDPSLIEHWKPSEASGVRVGSAGNYDLSDNNGVGQDPDGINGPAAAFVGANNQYLNSVNPALANFTQANYTLSFWLKYSQGASGTIWQGKPGDSFWRIEGGSMYLRMNGKPFLHNMPLEAFAYDFWFNFKVAVAKNGANWDYRFMVNNVTAVNVTGDPVGSGSSWDEFSIGAGAGADGLTASVDHVSFFNRALSLSEMQELYGGYYEGGQGPPEYQAA